MTWNKKKINNILSELKHLINWKTNSTFVFEEKIDWEMNIYINFLKIKENKNNLKAFIKNINKIKQIIIKMYD